MNTNGLTSLQVENGIKEILDKRFVKIDEISSLITNAFMSNKNAIIFGPAGHGKSQIMEYITNAVIPKRCGKTIDGECAEGHICTAFDSDGNLVDADAPCLLSHVFVQSFGEGMDESKLWGGLDLAKLQDENDPRFEYAPQYSFLNYSFAIFEEIFDAPTTVLLALKDTLTAREFRNGYQRYPMKTRCIVALTNKEPQEISDMGPSAHALIERFPLQLNLKWDSYASQDYLQMFNKVHPRKDTDAKKTLADIIGVAVEKGFFISPRSAMHALDVVVNNSDRGDSAYQALRFVPGFEGVLDNIENDLYEARVKTQYLDALTKLELEYEDARDEAIEDNDPIQCLRAIKSFKRIDAELEQMGLPDDLYYKRDDIRDNISKSISKMSNLAIDLSDQLD